MRAKNDEWKLLWKEESGGLELWILSDSESKRKKRCFYPGHGFSCQLPPAKLRLSPKKTKEQKNHKGSSRSAALDWTLIRTVHEVTDLCVVATVGKKIASI